MLLHGRGVTNHDSSSSSYRHIHEVCNDAHLCFFFWGGEVLGETTGPRPPESVEGVWGVSPLN